MIRVYKYGLLAPAHNGDIVRQQMRAAHRYRNTLVEIERGRRAAQRATMVGYAAVAAAQSVAQTADAALLAALREAKSANAAARSRSTTAEQGEGIKELRAAKAAAVAALKSARAAARGDDAVAAERARIDDLAADLRRNARAYCGAYWGTYLLIEDADMAARKMPLYDGAEPNDPRFQPWDGCGQIGVQVQHGITVPELHSMQDTRMRLRAVSELAWTAPTCGQRGYHQRTELMMRVGSEGRDPIWAVFPLRLHRPLPTGATIKRAAVSLRMIGPREQWTAEITIDTPEAEATCGDGAVAIDVGWRKVGDYLRVAAYRSDDGEVGEIKLLESVIGEMQKVQDLESIRDKSFNAARSLVVLPSNAPEWLHRAAKTIHQWRSPTRLIALANRWKANRFDGDAEVFEPLEAWRYHDVHLWRWESDSRVGALRRRKNHYRTVAAQLAKRYKVLVLEDFDLRKIAKKPTVESEQDSNGRARYARQLAAVSELRLCMQHAFTSRGGEVVMVDGADTTRTCNACGHCEKFDSKNHITNTCRACAAVWDQDENAAANILDRYREQRSAVQTAGGTRAPEKQGSRWARAKSGKAERLALAEALANRPLSM